MWKVVYTKTSLKNLPNLKSAHLDGKAHELIEVLRKNPFQNPPPHEKLQGNLSGAYSRRINIKHPLVYEVIQTPFEKDGMSYEGYVKIVSIWTHYEQ